MTMNWKDLVKLLGPQILAMTKLAPITPFVIAGIVAAEKIPGATGPEKLKQAKELVRLSIAAVNAQKGAEIIDTKIAETTLDHGISTVVGVINLLQKNVAAAA